MQGVKSGKRQSKCCLHSLGWTVLITLGKTACGVVRREDRLVFEG